MFIAARQTCSTSSAHALSCQPQATQSALLERLLPTPVGVITGIVSLVNERRYDVPATAICPEFSPDDLRAWIKSGDIPELAKTRQLEFLDIDSGHWPQVTQPTRLADLILAEGHS